MISAMYKGMYFCDKYYLSLNNTVEVYRLIFIPVITDLF